jgi:hypothetical protein
MHFKRLCQEKKAEGMLLSAITPTEADTKPLFYTNQISEIVVEVQAGCRTVHVYHESIVSDVRTKERFRFSTTLELDLSFGSRR